MQNDEKQVANTTSQSSDYRDHVTVTKQSYTLKMDLRLIPILGCTYTILFLDRTNSKRTSDIHPLESLLAR
jgi:hypothetical protein